MRKRWTGGSIERDYICHLPLGSCFLPFIASGNSFCFVSYNSLLRLDLITRLAEVPSTRCVPHSLVVVPFLSTVLLALNPGLCFSYYLFSFSCFNHRPYRFKSTQASLLYGEAVVWTKRGI